MNLKNQVKFWLNGIRHGIGQFKFAIKCHQKGVKSLFFNTVNYGYTLSLHSWMERDKWQEIDAPCYSTIHFCPITGLFWVQNGCITDVASSLDEAYNIASDQDRY